MNYRKVITGDPLGELLALRQRLEAAWEQMTEEERRQKTESHAKAMSKLAELEERERNHQAQKARARAFAEAYNKATPEQQARPLHEWLTEQGGQQV